MATSSNSHSACRPTTAASPPRRRRRCRRDASRPGRLRSSPSTHFGFQPVLQAELHDPLPGDAVLDAEHGPLVADAEQGAGGRLEHVRSPRRPRCGPRRGSRRRATARCCGGSTRSTITLTRCSSTPSVEILVNADGSTSRTRPLSGSSPPQCSSSTGGVGLDLHRVARQHVDLDFQVARDRRAPADSCPAVTTALLSWNTRSTRPLIGERMVKCQPLSGAGYGRSGRRRGVRRRPSHARCRRRLRPAGRERTSAAWAWSSSNWAISSRVPRRANQRLAHAVRPLSLVLDLAFRHRCRASARGRRERASARPRQTPGWRRPLPASASSASASPRPPSRWPRPAARRGRRAARDRAARCWRGAFRRRRPRRRGRARSAAAARPAAPRRCTARGSASCRPDRPSRESTRGRPWPDPPRPAPAACHSRSPRPPPRRNNSSINRRMNTFMLFKFG